MIYGRSSCRSTPPSNAIKTGLTAHGCVDLAAQARAHSCFVYGACGAATAAVASVTTVPSALVSAPARFPVAVCWAATEAAVGAAAAPSGGDGVGRFCTFGRGAPRFADDACGKPAAAAGRLSLSFDFDNLPLPCLSGQKMWQQARALRGVQPKEIEREREGVAQRSKRGHERLSHPSHHEDYFLRENRKANDPNRASSTHPMEHSGGSMEQTRAEEHLP